MGEGEQEKGRKDGSNDSLSVPEPLLDTQGLILSPDKVFHLLSQTQHKVAF